MLITIIITNIILSAIIISCENYLPVMVTAVLTIHGIFSML